MGVPLLGWQASEPIESVEEVRRKSKGGERGFGNRYGFELKLPCVKLGLEEGLLVSLLCREVETLTQNKLPRVRPDFLHGLCLPGR